MTKIKKLTSVLLSVIMLVCCFSVQVSAKSIFDNAIRISAMEPCSKTFKAENETIYYKLVLNDSGVLVFRCRDSLYTKYELYNANGQSISSGNGLANGGDLNGREIKIEKKGTYYLGVSSRDANSNFSDLYYIFTPDNTPAIQLALNLKVGDELDFSALATNYSGKCTWKTTDSKVAAVKAGTVTALKAGKAKIRAYMNNGEYAEITLIIKK